MSNYFNAAGEPLMTAAQARFEAELDEMSAFDRMYDEYDHNYERDVDPSTCDHPDTSSRKTVTGRYVWECDVCEAEIDEPEWDGPEDFGWFGDEALMGE